MDAEIASLISPRKGREMVIDAPTIWKRIQETYERNTPSRQNDGAMLRKLEERYFNGKKPLNECVNELYSGFLSRGFDAVAPSGQIPGNYAMVRKQELWAMVNRYRGLRV